MNDWLRFNIKTILFDILILFSSFSFSVEFKTGDILLQPLHCRLCDLIEEEEQSIYSHMGLVIVMDREVMILESFAFGVKLVSLAEFNKKTQRDQKLRHLRFKENHVIDSNTLMAIYELRYAGLQYDSDFLWDNFDERGLEKLYCSEMVVKILNEVIVWNYPIKRMTFTRRAQAWDDHFRGATPRNEWGNAPADFAKSAEFVDLGDVL